MKQYISKFHYKKKYNIIEHVIKGMLYIPSCVYGLISKVRNLLYDYGILRSERVNAKVISIGNLTTGGTGKTPITGMIADYLAQNGDNYKVGIISRGYGGKLPKDRVNLISDGSEVYYGAKEAGDEPYLLTKMSKKAIILTCANRVMAAKEAINKYGCSIILLDDCFQHRKINRDIDIIVIDSEKQLGNGCLLPQGPLREEECNIKRADKIIIVNKNNDIVDLIKYRNYIEEKYKKPTIVCNMDVDKILSIDNKKELPSIENNSDIYAFSAIGQPEQFYGYLEKRFKIIGKKSFEDHHLYSQKDIDDINNEAKKIKAKYLITTEKDAVKLLEYKSDIEIFVLKLKPNLDIKKLLS